MRGCGVCTRYARAVMVFSSHLSIQESTTYSTIDTLSREEREITHSLEILQLTAEGSSSRA
jgi:hypothetical protein